MAEKPSERTFSDTNSNIPSVEAESSTNPGLPEDLVSDNSSIANLDKINLQRKIIVLRITTRIATRIGIKI